jgi:hypothetical protein
MTGHVSLGPLSTALLRGAAPALHAACRGFEPRLPLHTLFRTQERAVGVSRCRPTTTPCPVRRGSLLPCEPPARPSARRPPHGRKAPPGPITSGGVSPSAGRSIRRRLQDRHLGDASERARWRPGGGRARGSRVPRRRPSSDSSVLRRGPARTAGGVFDGVGAVTTSRVMRLSRNPARTPAESTG